MKAFAAIAALLAAAPAGAAQRFAVIAGNDEGAQGRARASGLELGASRIPYEELRTLINASAADTKVAIVDACDAGRFTQTKGASFTASVDFALPTDEVEGTAFIASSAAGEAAQES